MKHGDESSGFRKSDVHNSGLHVLLNADKVLYSFNVLREVFIAFPS